MLKVNLAQLDAALDQAATNILEAAGDDPFVSRKDIRDKLKTLDGNIKILTDTLYRFILEREGEVNVRVTKKDVDAALEVVRGEIFPLLAIDSSVIREEDQGGLTEIAKKTALPLTFGLYDTANESAVIPAEEVFQIIKDNQEGLFLDNFGSEAGIPISAIHIEGPVADLTAETLSNALGLNPEDPAEKVEQFFDATPFLPVFIRQHLDFGFELQAEAVVNAMQNNLRDINVAIIGEEFSRDSNHPTYVVGVASDGSLVGFDSFVVWT